MSKPMFRRGFVKQGIALGGALVLHPGSSPAAEAKRPDNETLATIHELHTTHGNFTEREVPDEQVEQILEASVRAANSSNMQTYSVVMVGDRARQKEVCGYAGSRLLVYCVDYNRLKASAASLGHPYLADNMTAFVTGSINTAIAAQTAVIAARSLGIDSLLTNGIHRGDMARLWKLLDLPEQHCFPLVALVLGYATEQPSARKGRLTGVGEAKDEPPLVAQAEFVPLVFRHPVQHLFDS